MTTLPTGELEGLPVGGPSSLPGVKLQLRIAETDHRDDDELESIVAVVNAQVRRWPVAAYALIEDPPEWPADVVRGADKLAVRLWRLKDSPAGAETFAQLGAAYVERSDPEVAMLLRLGSYSPPGLG